MTQKVKVIELEATKLDPNACFLIVVSTNSGLSMDNLVQLELKLAKQGVRDTVILACEGSVNDMVKVFEIPKEAK